MVDTPDQSGSPERRVPTVEVPKPASGRTETGGSQAEERNRVSAAVPAEFRAADKNRTGDQSVEHSDRIHSRYPDGLAVREGDQPKKIQGPDPAADGAPHTVLKMDEANNRVYKAREYGEGGVPVRDIDFTHPTYPNGTPRPDHTAPEQHLYTPNDPDNPKAGYKRGPGEPLQP